MCGILALLLTGQIDKIDELLGYFHKAAKTLTHRGPDFFGNYSVKKNDKEVYMAHTRLAIIDPDSGDQPINHSKMKLTLGVNGEIYNYRDLKNNFNNEDFITNSDCEIILHIYNKFKNPYEICNQLRGMFSFVLVDNNNNDITIIVARDPIGIIPLFYGIDEYENIWFASEMKALITARCIKIFEFPSGSFMKLQLNEIQSQSIISSLSTQLVKWYQPDWSIKPYKDLFFMSNLRDLRNNLERSVTKHLMSDVPWGVLLSGGLDSSIIAALVCKHASKRIETNEKDPAWFPMVHTFSIGIKGAPDLIAAKKVAEHLGTIHHEFHFTVDEGINAMNDVIYHLETFDRTTCRASAPMYLMARKIKTMGIKMVLSGEGADELFGGYLYFRRAPNHIELFEETRRKVLKLHQFDLVRANKSMMAFGIELRVPFLDTDFINYAMNLAPQYKMSNDRIEKYILREAFADLLPSEIVWRQKEQFSDGCGYDWIDTLKKYTSNLFSVENAEDVWYKTIFNRYFPSDICDNLIPIGKSIACSTSEIMHWDKNFNNMNDPSGRSVKGIHNNSY
jgi:asparagine synthase (glutamine-hydrolysing)